ncbi:hypothetical protein BASA81_004810 [Batrachochytrium salamandrivorans]|nr:hypothetical protein BASA81_004810 [Batrachochytrium salamandrivorans]
MLNDSSATWTPTGSPEALVHTPQKLFEYALMLWMSASMFVMSAVFFILSALPFKYTKRFSKSFDIAGWSVLYFAFSISLVVYNKWLISIWGFNFPITITLIHMMLKLMISRGIVRGCRRSEEIPTISNRAYLLFAVPVGATTALDVAASNASLFYVTVTVYTIVKSTALFFVLIYSILYKLQHCDWRLFGCTGIILAGVLMASMKETSFEWIGFTLVFMSAALGGYRWALTEVLMHNKMDSPGKMNALMTIYVISPASVLVMIPFFFWFEFDSFLKSPFYSDAGLFTLVIVNVLASGLFAFAMIYVELAVLKRTSSLSLVVIGYVKQMLQICFSALLFHDVLLPINIGGIVVTFLGMGIYSGVKHHKRSMGPSSAAVSPEREPVFLVEEEEGVQVFEDINLHQLDGEDVTTVDNIPNQDNDEESAQSQTRGRKKKGLYEMVQI